MKKNEALVLSVLFSLILSSAEITFIEASIAPNAPLHTHIGVILVVVFSCTILCILFYSLLRHPEVLKNVLKERTEGLEEEKASLKSKLETSVEEKNKINLEFQELKGKSQILEGDNQELKESLQEKISERRDYQKQIARLNQCFLSLGTDASKNIEIITETANELLRGTLVFYSLAETNNEISYIGRSKELESTSGTIDASGFLSLSVIKENPDMPFIIHDLQNSRFAASDPYVKDHDLSTYIGCPVRDAGRAIGCLAVLFKEDRQFSLEEINLMRILAKHIEIEEARRQAEEKILSSYKHLGLVNRKISLLTNLVNVKKKSDLNEVFEYITKSSINLSQARFSALYLFQQTTDSFMDLSYQGFFDGEEDEFDGIVKKLHLFDDLKKQCKRKQALLNDLVFNDCELLTQRDFRHLLALPLIYNKELFGALFLGFNEASEPSHQELDLYELFAMQAATTLAQVISEKAEFEN